jgi:hypothetical protein
MKNRLTSIGIVCLLVITGFLGFITFEPDIVTASSIIYTGSGPENLTASGQLNTVICGKGSV